MVIITVTQTTLICQIADLYLGYDLSYRLLLKLIQKYCFNEDPGSIIHVFLCSQGLSLTCQ